MSLTINRHWSHGLLALSLLACGARSTLDEDGLSAAGGTGANGGGGGTSPTVGGSGGAGGAGGTGGIGGTGGVGGTGGGGGVVDPECPPLDTTFCSAPEPCYTGPAAVAGKGTCSLGQRDCSAAGAGHLECAAQVLPRPDNCAAPTSWTCDDAPHPCHPLLDIAVSTYNPSEIVVASEATHFMHNGSRVLRFDGGAETWDLTPDDSASESIKSLTIDASSNVIFAGRSGAGAYVMKVTALGDFVWRRDLISSVLEDPVESEFAFLSTTPDGGFFAAGSSKEGFLPLDGMELPAGAFVGKFGADGVLQWITSLQLTPTVQSSRADGSVVVGGHGHLPCGGYGAKIVAVDAAGQVLWTWAGRDAGPVLGGVSDSFLNYSAVNRVEVDPLGNVYAVGRLMNETDAALDFGDGLPKTGQTFILSLDAAGEHRWSHGFEHGGGNFGNGAGPAGPLVRTPNGQLVWATQIDDQGFLRTFAADGTILWERPIHTNELNPAMSLHALEALPSGNLLLGGQPYNIAEFEGGWTINGLRFKAIFGP